MIGLASQTLASIYTTPSAFRRQRRRRLSMTDDSAAEDYSAAATLVRFDPPLPLLRAPVPSAAPDEGPVLAFRDAASWRAAWDAAEVSLVSQCEVNPPDDRLSPE